MYSHLEYGQPAERQIVKNRIDKLIWRTKLTPFIAAAGLASAAFYGASESPPVGGAVTLIGGLSGLGMLIAERMHAESQIKKAVDTYSKTQGSDNKEFHTLLTADEEGQFTTKIVEDDVAKGKIYEKQKDNLRGETFTAAGSPSIGTFYEMYGTDRLSSTDSVSKIFVVGAASLTVAGLVTTYKSANRLQESAYAQLDNIDGSLKFAEG